MSFNDTTSGSAPKTNAHDEIVLRWREASKEQDQILSDVLARNLELEARVKELEYVNWRLRDQLKDYKTELKVQEEKKLALRTQFETIKSENDSFKNENSLAVCLLDGDGCIFEQDYLRDGQEGGIRAAAELSSQVMRYMRQSQMPPGTKVITMVFLAKSGLESVLHRNGICTPDEFTNFLNGFVGAHQLFSIVDVGMGKEAADHKLREYLDMFTRMPQTFKVFFGGAHDNGYHGSLASLQTLGYKEKLVLLQSYTQTAREIGTLRLPTLEIPGLFMANKLDTRPVLKRAHAHSEPVLPYGINQPLQSSSSSQRKRSNSQSKAAKKKAKAQAAMTSAGPIMGADPSVPQVHNAEILVEEELDEYQLPCMYQHLSDLGCQSMQCPFDHDNEPTPKQYEDLKDMASATPCRFINANIPCTLKVCHFGHECPRGPRCTLYGQNLCKFVGNSMHD